MRREGERLDRARLVEGSAELVRELARRGTRFAIVTRNSRRTVESAFVAFELPRPVVIVGLEDVIELKPDPAAGRIALAALGVRPAECAVVGDTHHDLDMASLRGLLRIRLTID
jgi:phosphoglycolate phosphatase